MEKEENKKLNIVGKQEEEVKDICIDRDKKKNI